MVSAARSRDIRFTFIIQNFAQLNDVYGDNVAEIIKGNCGNLVYLISTEMKALEEISKMCGEVKVTDEKDKNATRPLITITDLQKPTDFGMSSYNPFGMPSANSGFKPNPGGLSNMDIDSMLKDLDEKFKELDRQEEEQKKKNMETKSDDKLLEIKNEVKEDPLINIKEENPKINVDADSKVIADNVVSDDEFFDDFFGDSDE